MVHKAKLDVWLLAAIVFAIATILLGANRWVAGTVLAVLLICACPQYYETTPDGLLIHAGVSRTLIRYAAITFVGPNPEHASAVISPGNICIQYGCGSQLVIAPADPGGFLSDLAVRAPHLEWRGQKLVAALA